jgi:hypothetical protein
MAQWLLRLALLSAACVALAGRSSAITIDDFSQGAYSHTGAASATQSGLNPAHTVGGRRDIVYGNPVPPDTVQIDSSAGALSFSSPTNYGYLDLMYGMGGPLGVNLLSSGHDRFRFRFSNVVAQHAFFLWVSVNSPLPPTSNSPVDLSSGLVALSGGGGVLEVPFRALPANYLNVNTIAIDLGRFPAGASFVLDEIVTAGPPIPGDYDRDGQVSNADFIEWKRHFGKSTVLGNALLAADGNGDKHVDAADYVIWRKHVGTTSGPGGGAGAAAHSVPEPVALYVVVTAIGGLLATRYGCCFSVFNSHPIEAAHG